MLKVLEKIPKIFGHLYTILIVLISWVIFAFEDLQKIGIYLSSMFNLNGINFVNPEAMYYLNNYIVIIIIGIICSIPLKKVKEKLLDNTKSKKKEIIVGLLGSIACVFIVIVSTASLVNNSFNPFLYFRF